MLLMLASPGANPGEHVAYSTQTSETRGRGASAAASPQTTAPGTSALVVQLREELHRVCEALDAGRADWRAKEADHVSLTWE